jgi:hypothetical protein
VNCARAQEKSYAALSQFNRQTDSDETWQFKGRFLYASDRTARDLISASLQVAINPLTAIGSPVTQAVKKFLSESQSSYNKFSFLCRYMSIDSTLL